MRNVGPVPLVLTIAVLILAGGCTSVGASRDKAGGPGEPVVLRMAGATGDPRLHPSVDYFVQRVEEISGGELRIELVNGWGDFAPDAEQQIVRDVAAGEFDLGSVGTGVFDTMGVVRFQALTAPMLIDSYALQDAVIQSGITDEMMRSLDGVGVVGLGVVPDGLRKPIGVASPILAPADWRHIAFGTMRSNGQAEAIRALGAAPVELNGRYLDTAADEGTVQGFDLGFPLYDTTLQHSAPFVTWNVNLWPLMDVVLANPASLLALTADRRAWLEKAAEDAAARSADLAERELRLIQNACATGVRFAEASTENVAALRDAFAPVYDELGTDPATRSFIARIRALKRSTPAEPAAMIPADCRIGVPAATPPASNPGTTATAALPTTVDGTYRYEITLDEAEDAAMVDPVESYPQVITVVMNDGTFSMNDGDLTGTYTVENDRVTFDIPDFGYLLHFKFSLDQRRNLHLAPIAAMDRGDAFVFSNNVWMRIG